MIYEAFLFLAVQAGVSGSNAANNGYGTVWQYLERLQTPFAVAANVRTGAFAGVGGLLHPEPDRFLDFGGLWKSFDPKIGQVCFPFVIFASN